LYLSFISGEILYFVMTGAILGLTAGLSPGPLLALVITETITHSKSEGIKIAVSPLITDLPVIVLTYFLFSRLSHFNIIMGLISFLGGLFLLYLGYECVRTKGMHINVQKSGSGSLLKGIAANALNPHPYLFWITIGTPVALKAYQISVGTVILFFVSFYSLLIGSKIGVALIVDRSKAFIKDKMYIRIMRILGFALFIFAIFFFAECIKNLKIPLPVK